MRSVDFFRTTSPRLVLEDYLEVNADTAPRDTLLQLAPFALLWKIGQEEVGRLFTINPRTARIHRSWFIWNTLRLSGLEDHWYADEMNHGTLKYKGWIRRIERHGTDEQKDRWRRLLYNPAFPDPSSWNQTRLWTKGGSWWKKLGMARILVMKEHLERPPHPYYSTHGLNDENCRKIERELMAVCNPDHDIMPTQYHRAVRYLQSRTADFAGRPMRMEATPWFFQMNVTNEENRWYLLKGGRRRNHYVSIEW